MKDRTMIPLTHEEMNLVAHALGVLEEFYMYGSGKMWPHAAANSNKCHDVRHRLYALMYESKCLRCSNVQDSWNEDEAPRGGECYTCWSDRCNVERHYDSRVKTSSDTYVFHMTLSCEGDLPDDEWIAENAKRALTQRFQASLGYDVIGFIMEERDEDYAWHGEDDHERYNYVFGSSATGITEQA